MKQIFTNETLAFFKEYEARTKKALDEGERTIPSFMLVLNNMGIEVNHLMEEGIYELSIKGDDITYHITKQDDESSSQFRVRMLSSLNYLINEVHQPNKFMVRNQFAKAFEYYITTVKMVEWDDYLKLNFYARLGLIIDFAIEIGVPLKVHNDSLTLEDSFSLKGIARYNAEGLTLNQRITLWKTLVEDISDYYNNYVNKLNKLSPVKPLKMEDISSRNNETPHSEPDTVHQDEESPKENYLKAIQYTLSRVYDTIEAKNSDYTADNADPLTNFLKSSNYDVDPINGILIRIQDKMSRISGLVSGHEAKVVDEKIDDTIKDGIGYFANMGALIDRLITDPSNKEQALVLVIDAIEDLLNLKTEIENK